MRNVGLLRALRPTHEAPTKVKHANNYDQMQTTMAGEDLEEGRNMYLHQCEEKTNREAGRRRGEDIEH